MEQSDQSSERVKRLTVVSVASLLAGCGLSVLAALLFYLPVYGSHMPQGEDIWGDATLVMLVAFAAAGLLALGVLVGAVSLILELARRTAAPVRVREGYADASHDRDRSEPEGESR